MRIDLHTHSSAGSGCSIQTVDQIVRDAARCLDAVCLTDHNSLAGAERAMQCSRETGFPVFVGVEAEIGPGHYLVFADPPTDLRDVHDLDELPDALKAREHAVIPAHVFRNHGGDRVAEDVRRHRDLFAAIEVYNSNCCDLDTSRNLELALELGLPGVGCSDAHDTGITGIHYTDFEDRIETLAELIRALKSGRYQPCRRAI